METVPKKNILSRLGGEIIALLVLIPLVIILGLILLRFNQAPTPSPSPSPALVATTAAPSPSPTARAITQTITLEIKNGSSRKTYAIPATSRISVADLLEQAKAQGLQLVTKDYGDSLGLFIESINGQASDPATKRYWHLYINDQLSPLGASSAQVTAGDTVRWSFETEHSE